MPNPWDPPATAPAASVGNPWDKPAAPGYGEVIGNALTEGGYRLLGLPGDLIQGIGKPVGKWLGNQLREATGKAPLVGEPPDPLGVGNVPTSDALEQRMGFTPLPDQSGIKGVVQEVGRLAPGAVTLGGGVGSALAKEGVGAAAKAAAGNAIKYAAVPGAAGEGVGQAMKSGGMAAEEPWVKAITEMITGLGAGLRTKPDLAAPTDAEITGQAKALYNSPAVKELTVKPESFDRFVQGITSDKEFKTPFGLSPIGHPQGVGSVDWLKTANEAMKAPGASLPTLDDLDMVRQGLNASLEGAISAGNDADVRKVAMLKSKLDDYIANLDPNTDVVSGDPAAANAAIKQARSLWAIKNKSDLINDAFKRAQNSASAKNMNMENALTIEFRKIANRDYLMKQFTPDEQGVINDIVRGSSGERLMRRIGSLGVRSPFGALLALGEMHTGGVGLAAGLAGAAEAARRAATGVTERNARMLHDMVRSGGAGRPITYPGLSGALSMGTFDSLPMLPGTQPDRFNPWRSPAPGQ